MLEIEDVEYFGTKFKVVVPSSIGLPRHSTAEFRDHEPVLQTWIDGIQSGDVVIDGGSQFGNYFLPALYKGAFVIGYEPYSENATILRANVAANGWAAEIREVGLWCREEPYPEGILKQLGMPLSMPTVTLDEEAERYSSELDDMSRNGRKLHIKLDTEGTELGIIQGGLRLIEKHKPRLVIENHESVSQDPACEVSRYPERVESSKNMERILKDFGYEIEKVPWDVSRWYWVCTQ